MGLPMPNRPSMSHRNTYSSFTTDKSLHVGCVRPTLPRIGFSMNRAFGKVISAGAERCSVGLKADSTTNGQNCTSIFRQGSVYPHTMTQEASNRDCPANVNVTDAFVKTSEALPLLVKSQTCNEYLEPDPRVLDYNSPEGAVGAPNTPYANFARTSNLAKEKLSSREVVGLYVRNVPLDMRNEELGNIFRQFGTVLSIFIKSPDNKAYTKTYAIVKVPGMRDAVQMVAQLNNAAPWKFRVELALTEEERQKRKMQLQAGFTKENEFISQIAAYEASVKTYLDALPQAEPSLTPHCGVGRGRKLLDAVVGTGNKVNENAEFTLHPPAEHINISPMSMKKPCFGAVATDRKSNNGHNSVAPVDVSSVNAPSNKCVHSTQGFSQAHTINGTSPFAISSIGSNSKIPEYGKTPLLLHSPATPDCSMTKVAVTRIASSTINTCSEAITSTLLPLSTSSAATGISGDGSVIVTNSGHLLAATGVSDAALIYEQSLFSKKYPEQSSMNVMSTKDACVSSTKKAHVCISCLEGAALRCSVCKASYCSSACQLHDWYYHKQDCRPPPPLEYHQTPDDTNQLPDAAKVKQEPSSGDSAAGTVDGVMKNTSVVTEATAVEVLVDLSSETMHPLLKKSQPCPEIHSVKLGSPDERCTGTNQVEQRELTPRKGNPIVINPHTDQLPPPSVEAESACSTIALPSAPDLMQASPLSPVCVPCTPLAVDKEGKSPVVTCSIGSASALLKVGSSYSGIVTTLKDVKSFTLLLFVDTTQEFLEEGMVQLELCPSVASFSPNVGDIVAAQSQNDLNWYRSYVCAVQSSGRYSVCHVDFGYMETVEAVKPLPEGMCRSVDGTGFYATIIDDPGNNFEELSSLVVCENLVSFKILSKDKETFEIAILDEKGNENVKYKLDTWLHRVVSEIESHEAENVHICDESPISQICMRTVDSNQNKTADEEKQNRPMLKPSENVLLQQPLKSENKFLLNELKPISSPLESQPQSCGTPSLFLFSNLKALSLDVGEKYSVLPVWCEGDYLFVQVATDELLGMFRGLMANIGDHCDLAEPPETVREGDLVCGYIASDALWYRALVLQVHSNTSDSTTPTSVKLFFVDFGNCEEVEMCYVRPFIRSFLEVPIMSVKVALCADASVKAIPGRQLRPLLGVADILKDLLEAGLFLKMQLMEKGKQPHDCATFFLDYFLVKLFDADCLVCINDTVTCMKDAAVTDSAVEAPRADSCVAAAKGAGNCVIASTQRAYTGVEVPTQLADCGAGVATRTAGSAVTSPPLTADSVDRIPPQSDDSDVRVSTQRVNSVAEDLTQRANHGTGVSSLTPHCSTAGADPANYTAVDGADKQPHLNNTKNNETLAHLKEGDIRPAHLMYEECKCLRLEAGEDVELVVLCATNPHTIMIMPQKDVGLLEKLEELSTSMQQYCNSLPTVYYEPLVGEVVLAKFSQDGLWYRAACLHVDRIQRAAVVQFVDYGNVDSALFDCIVQMVTGFTSPLPFLALHAVLEGAGTEETDERCSDVLTRLLPPFTPVTAQRVSQQDPDTLAYTVSLPRVLQTLRNEGLLPHS